MAKRESPHILIVDDDRPTQRMLADALHRLGFTVTAERDGEWALKTFEKKRFDAVLLDLLLPALSGNEVARKLRATAKGKKTPILMISGVYKSAIHQREAVQKHGAFAFLEKPVQLHALEEALRSALGDRYPAPSQARPLPSPVEEDDRGSQLADLSAREEASQVERQARETVTGFQAIRGELARRPFPEVLAEIYRWRGQGALLLRRENAKKIAYFRDGTPSSIKSNLLTECLGRVMVREKMISEDECEESLKKMKSTGRQQGTVLVEMGCISPHNLVYALNLQLQLKLFDVFAWTSGEFQFNPKAALPSETVNLEMTAAAIIYEGVRRCYDQARLEQLLGAMDSLFVHPSDEPLYALQDAGLGEEENQLLQAADGHKTVATLRALNILPPLETNRFLYAMKCAQMIGLRDKPAEGKPRPSLFKQAEAGQKPPPLPPQPPQLPPALPASDNLPTDPGGDHSREERSSRASRASSGSGRPRVLARSAGSLLPELAMPSASGLSGEESAVRDRLVNRAAQLRKMDYFQILGLPREASREEVKQAYFALAKEYHPDKHFGSASAEVRQLAGQIYALISTAHDTLADSHERQRYLKDLHSGLKREMGDEVGKILAAEGKFQKGEELLRRRSFKAASELFRDAIELYGEEGEFHAYLGWSLFQLAPDDSAAIDSALRSLETAVSLNPRLDRSYLFTGYIYKATGRPDKAERQFEKAIQCNPDCTEALRELRILGKGKK